MSPFEPIKVLIADDDNQLSRRLADHLNERGFEARVAVSGKEARTMIVEWQPRFVLADLMLPEGNAISLIEYIKNEKALRHQFIHVIVLSGHNLEANVRQAVQSGAKDYLVKPFRFEDVHQRLLFHSRPYRQVSSVEVGDKRVEEASMMLHLTDLVLKQALGGGTLEEILFNLTRMVSLKMSGVRCSIVHVPETFHGVVVTSNDERGASGIRLNLNKYPEILHVMNGNVLVAIENLDNNPEMRELRQLAKDITFNSMIVCPVTRRGQPFGVLSLRMPPEKQTVSDNEIRFVEIVAQVISLTLSGENHKEFEDFWLRAQGPKLLPFHSSSRRNS
jgi:DNA-binding response OmpR family regulator